MTPPLTAEVMAALWAHPLARCATDDHVFKAIPKSLTLRNDLNAAGIPYVVNGAKLDFHSLRVTSGTMLATSGVPLRTAMELMRHTHIRLTTKTYADPLLIDTPRGRGQVATSDGCAHAATATRHRDVRRQYVSGIGEGGTLRT
ncbi:MAG: tyrosine-type recombinase/integrase [Phycisphaerae bacterium]